VEIVIARDARKVLARIQPAKAKDIAKRSIKWPPDPNARNNNLRTLKGVPNGFRIRVGD
jgi:mRNA-degrading endonuclease RelE of RelBE toxin-antitoxin system